MGHLRRRRASEQAVNDGGVKWFGSGPLAFWTAPALGLLEPNQGLADYADDVPSLASTSGARVRTLRTSTSRRPTSRLVERIVKLDEGRAKTRRGARRETARRAHRGGCRTASPRERDQAPRRDATPAWLVRKDEAQGMELALRQLRASICNASRLRRPSSTSRKLPSGAFAGTRTVAGPRTCNRYVDPATKSLPLWRNRRAGGSRRSRTDCSRCASGPDTPSGSSARRRTRTRRSVCVVVPAERLRPLAERLRGQGDRLTRELVRDDTETAALSP